MKTGFDPKHRIEMRYISLSVADIYVKMNRIFKKINGNNVIIIVDLSITKCHILKTNVFS